MIKIFSFVASCAGKKSHTLQFSNELAEAFRKKAEAEGETVEYEVMTGADLRIDYCRSCISCFMNGVCPLDKADDMELLKKKIIECDIFMFGSPVYLWEMSGLAKSFFDRISYWAHRFDLLAKPCVVFSTTDSSHGREVAANLAQLMRFTGAIVVNAGHKETQGVDIDPDVTAEAMMKAYKEPEADIPFFQERIFLSRVVLVRKYFRKLGPDKTPIDEMRVFRERGLDKYVVMKEAIEGLGPEIKNWKL